MNLLYQSFLLFYISGYRGVPVVQQLLYYLLLRLFTLPVFHNVCTKNEISLYTASAMVFVSRRSEGSLCGL